MRSSEYRMVYFYCVHFVRLAFLHSSTVSQTKQLSAKRESGNRIISVVR